MMYYNLYPTGYLPLCICKEPDSFPDHMRYTTDSNRFYQYYDTRLPQAEEDEEEEDDK